MLKHTYGKLFSFFFGVSCLVVIQALLIHHQDMRQYASSNPSPFVSTHGRDLSLNGTQYKSIGVNRYNLLQGSICGGLDSATIPTLFSEWHQIGVTSVRFWMFQDNTKSGTDFTGFDTLITLANQYNIKLIPVFENQWQDCTNGGYKSTLWYQSGYKTPYGGYPLSLNDYITKVVIKYKDNPSILMWQIMNEAESTDTTAFYNFVKDVSSHIKSLDANHLVSFGTMGSGQPGTSIYRNIHALPTIDILEYHDYNAETLPLPSTLNDRFNDSISLNKPLIVGEAGISINKFSTQQRATLFQNKMNTFFQKGGTVYLIWSYRGNNPQGGGEFDFTLTDPLSNIIKTIAATFPQGSQITPTLNPTGGVSNTPTLPPSSGDTIFSFVICPHGLGSCGDNVNPNSGGNINPKHQQRTVTLTFLNAQNQPVGTAQGTVSYTSSAGNFQGSIRDNIPTGQYLIRIQTEGFLSKQLSGIITVIQGQQVTIPAVSLVAGDIDNNGQIDILDYNIFIGCFGSKFTTSSCLAPATSHSPGADIDDDGAVDGADYNLFLRELSVQHGG